MHFFGQGVSCIASSSFIFSSTSEVQRFFHEKIVTNPDHARTGTSEVSSRAGSNGKENRPSADPWRSGTRIQGITNP